MQRSSVSKIIIEIILGISIFLLVTSFAVLFTLKFKPLYYSNIERHDLVSNTGWSYEKITNNYDILIDYNSIFGPDKLVFDDIRMSEEGDIHFEEVKAIFIAIEVIFVVSLAVTVLLGVYCFNPKNAGDSVQPTSYRPLLLATILNFVVPIIIIIRIAIDWETAFVLFHNIFFRNDYWIFDQYTDPVIKILPDTFFMECAIMIISIIFVTGILLYIVYKKKRQAK